jgi:hypothetical protein
VTADTRSTLAPDLPTFAETGPPTLTYSEWFGLFAPRGTPKDIIGKLNAAVVEAAHQLRCPISAPTIKPHENKKRPRKYSTGPRS